MLKRGIVVLAVAAFFAAAGRPKDAKDVVNDVARTIGATDVNSLQYSATGFVYNFGQNPTPYVRYPKFYARYSRMIDYEKEISREETIRAQFENPPHGGGGQPLYREARSVAVATGNSAWGGGALELTPQGWAKAARATSPTMKSMTVKGKPMTVVSFVKGKYKIDGYVDPQNLLEKIDTWTPNPILGDMLIETRFSDYKDFSGVKFPTKIVQDQGGFPVLEVTVNQLQTNVPVNIDVPRQAQSATPPAAHVESQKVADGVWYLAGTPDPNSQVVEFKDFSVVIESSVTEGRALANIAEAKRLVPNKPIRYHVNSHHHSDHAAGLRAFVAEGSLIVSHEMNKQFYEQTVLKAPHTLDPDRLTQEPKAAKFIWVKDKYVITDGDRRLEIYWIQGAGHADNLLMSYLPKEKILFITDIFNQFGEPRPNDPPPGIVSPYYNALGDNLKRLNLEVERLAPSHGKEVVSIDVLKKALEGKVQAPPIVPLSGN